MRIARLLILCLFITVAGTSQEETPVFAPQLQAGEGLAVAGTDLKIELFGEAMREAPMGSLAKLVWLRLEGEDWSALGVEYKCTGRMDTDTCWLSKGHGKVDLAKATEQSCNLAYLAWARMSAERWARHYGEGAARARMDEVFSPFLGSRLPAGDTIPKITPAWVGDGELLRTSPEAMLQWLVDPAQEQLLALTRRLLLGFMREHFRPDVWWMKTGTAPVLSDPTATSAWVVGSNGKTIAVLHLPRGRGKAEGLERFQALMGIPAKK